MECSFFLNGNRGEVDLVGRGMGGQRGTGRVEGEETEVRMYSLKEE